MPLANIRLLTLVSAITSGLAPITRPYGLQMESIEFNCTH